MTVVDASAPTIDAGPDQTLEASSTDGAAAGFGFTGSDSCGAVTLTHAPDLPNYPIGVTAAVIFRG